MTGAANGAGTVSGSDRVELIWADRAITEQWLEVTVKATADTGLTSNDVFFFGNEIGDANKANTSTMFKVTASDATATQIHGSPMGNNNPITNVFDYNRDGTVGAADITLDQTHGTTNSTGLVAINIASGGPFAPLPPSGNGSDTSGAAPAAIGGAAVASSLASPASSPSPTRPAWLVNRLSNVDLHSGGLTTFFEHLAHEATTKSWAILVKGGRVEKPFNLDDELLDGLLAGLKLE
jgi:hypothetical protein